MVSVRRGMLEFVIAYCIGWSEYFRFVDVKWRL